MPAADIRETRVDDECTICIINKVGVWVQAGRTSPTGSSVSHNDGSTARRSLKEHNLGRRVPCVIIRHELWTQQSKTILYVMPHQRKSRPLVAVTRCNPSTLRSKVFTPDSGLKSPASEFSTLTHSNDDTNCQKTWTSEWINAHFQTGIFRGV